MDEPTESKAYDYLLRTPSPKSKRKSWGSLSPPTFSDRLIPSRVATDFPCGLNLLEVKENVGPSNVGSLGSSFGVHATVGDSSISADLYDKVLQCELLGKPPPKRDDERSFVVPLESQKLFQYMATEEEAPGFGSDAELPRSPLPLRIAEHQSSPPRPMRKIQKSPVRIMDAPNIHDDFYSNLLDWSAADDLAVALEGKVYLWNASNNRVSLSCDVDPCAITSVKWSPDGHSLAVGSSSGNVTLWDRAQGRSLRTMKGHEGYVNSIAWNGHVLSTGGSDGCILHTDMRQSANYFAKVCAHQGHVCGLKWSADDHQLASGSDDCTVRIWNLRSPRSYVLQCVQHKGAVKALSWSPHQGGLLASGGGVSDKRIHIWNTTNDVTVKDVGTGSQVCNLSWSKNVNEIVSTHGYSHYEVAVWKYPAMTRVATLTGHSQRVLYLATSPDGCKIATGSGDCTIRVWDVFPAGKAGSMRSPRKALNLRTIR